MAGMKFEAIADRFSHFCKNVPAIFDKDFFLQQSGITLLHRYTLFVVAPNVYGYFFYFLYSCWNLYIIRNVHNSRSVLYVC